MTQKKSFFNIIDIALILVIIAIVAGSIVKYRQSRVFINDNTSKQISYTVVIENADRNFRQNIEKGDTVYLSESGLEAGVISHIAKSPTKTYIENDDEETLEIKYDPSTVDLTLVINTYAAVNDNGCYICDSFFIASGKDIRLYTTFSEFEGTITNVSQVK